MPRTGEDLFRLAMSFLPAGVAFDRAAEAEFRELLVKAALRATREDKEDERRSEVDGGVFKFVKAMVEGANLRKVRIIDLEAVAYARRGLCPIWPIC